MDKDVLVTSLKLAPKTQNSQIYKHHNIAPFGPKSEKAQYGESQKGGENRKDKGDGENGRVERSGRGYCENKINLIVGKSSGSKASVYHHIIYQCYQGIMFLG